MWEGGMPSRVEAVGVTPMSCGKKGLQQHTGAGAASSLLSHSRMTAAAAATVAAAATSGHSVGMCGMWTTPQAATGDKCRRTACAASVLLTAALHRPALSVLLLLWWTCVCVCVPRRYIIGLPLHQRNATAMSRQLMITAKKELGPALQGFELGNEVRLTGATAHTCVCWGGGAGV